MGHIMRGSAVSTRRPSVRRRLAAAVVRAAAARLVRRLRLRRREGRGVRERLERRATSQSGDAVTVDEFAGLHEDAVDNATTAHMTMDMAMGRMGSMQAEGDARLRDQPLSMSMTMTHAGRRRPRWTWCSSTRHVHEAAPPERRQVLELDLSDTDNLPPGMADMLDQMDPMKSVEAVRRRARRGDLRGHRGGRRRDPRPATASPSTPPVAAARRRCRSRGGPAQDRRLRPLARRRRA